MSWSRRPGISGSVAAVLAVVLVALAGVAAYEFVGVPNGGASSGSSSGSSGTGGSVRVFGLVSTSGAGTRPTELVFMDSETGRAVSAPVEGSSYFAQVPNHRVYNVSLEWAGNYTWQNSSTDMGQLTVDMQEESMMAQSYNVVQSTPDSVVEVNGTVSWQIVTSCPGSIEFTACVGQVFQADVVGRSFSARLPNMMTYEVEVGGSNATGYVEWYYFHQLKVDAGVDVIGITVILGR